MADLTNADYLMARADLARAQATKAERELEPDDPTGLIDTMAIQLGIPVPEARAWLESQMNPGAPQGSGPFPYRDETGPGPGPAAPPVTIDPEIETALRSGLGDLMTQKNLTGKTDFANFQTGRGNKVQAAALQQSLEQALDPQTATPTFARTLSVGAGKDISPFTSGPAGVLDTSTGVLDESGAYAMANRALLGAKEGKEEKHGRMYDAKRDQAHAKSTGKGSLAPAEQRMFIFYQDAFPDDTLEDTFNRVKARRGEDPAVQFAKDQRAIKAARPRWSAEEVNAEAEKYRIGRESATKKAPKATKSTMPEAHGRNVESIRSLKANPTGLRTFVKGLKDAGWSRAEVEQMLKDAGID
jgi:hypothetical protein